MRETDGGIWPNGNTSSLRNEKGDRFRKAPFQKTDGGMGSYDVYVYCDRCNDFHRLGRGISLANGPRERQSIADAYSGKELPQNLKKLLERPIECPETGKPLDQKDNDEVFLVPIVFLG